MSSSGSASSGYDPLKELQSQLARRSTACSHHPPISRPVQTPVEADQWQETIGRCSPEARWAHLRWLALNDLYYLLVHIFEIKLLKTQWHIDRIREVEANSDGIMDLWSRGTGKSAVKTFGHVIQEVLRNPEITIGIFSHTRPIAKDFLKKIKTTFEGHELLRWLFPDVIWESCEGEAPVWSIDRGITLKRKSVTRGECTVEAWGLVDSQPTSKHFDLLCYDDIQKEQVTEYMIEQIEDSFDTSLGLGATKPPRWWMCGVFFRGGSVYESLIDRSTGLARVRPAFFEDGTSPIYTDDQVHQTLKNLKPGTIACEYLMDPTKKATNEGFQESWLRFHNGLSPEDLNACNLYIVVDPGKGKENKGRSGKTCMQVIALHANRKRYLIDAIKAAMSLEQRTNWLFALHRQYNEGGRIKKVGYEQYGLQADIEHIRLEQAREGYYFDIVPLSAHSQKDERIEGLVPVYKQGEMILPKSLPKRIVGGEETDFLEQFVKDEYLKWPATKIKDGLDCQSWILFRNEKLPNVWLPHFPESWEDPSIKRNIDFDESGGPGGSWMSA